jgi:hypothetical protein
MNAQEPDNNDLLSLALSMADGAENLTPENRLLMRDLVRSLRRYPDKSQAIAVQSKMEFLLLKQRHAAMIAAVRASDLRELDKWRLQKGEPISPLATPTPGLMPKPKRQTRRLRP